MKREHLYVVCGVVGVVVAIIGVWSIIHFAPKKTPGSNITRVTIKPAPSNVTTQRAPVNVTSRTTTAVSTTEKSTPKPDQTTVKVTTTQSTNEDNEDLKEKCVKTVPEGSELVESRKEESFILKTLATEVELTELKLNIASMSSYNVRVKIQSVRCGWPLSLSRQGRKSYHSKLDVVAISTEQTRVVLSANTEYKVTLYSDTPFYLGRLSTPKKTYEHFTLKFPRNTTASAHSQCEYMSFPFGISYKTLNSKANGTTQKVNKTTTQSINEDNEPCKPPEEKYVKTFEEGSHPIESRTEEFFGFKTLSKRVEFTGLKLKIASVGSYDITVKIQQVGSDRTLHLSRQGIKSNASDLDIVQITTEYERVVLSANSEYNVTLYCDKPLVTWISSKFNYTNENFILKFPWNAATNVFTEHEFTRIPYGIFYKTLRSEANATTPEDIQTTTQSIDEDTEEYHPSDEKFVNTLPAGAQLVESRKEESFTLKTLGIRLELTGLIRIIPSESNITVKIQRVDCGWPLILSRHGNNTHGNVAISTEQDRVLLSANAEYKVTLSSDKPLYVWNSPTPHEKYEHLTLKFTRNTAANASYMSFLNVISYRTLSSEPSVTTEKTPESNETTTISIVEGNGKPEGTFVGTITSGSKLVESREKERYTLKTLGKNVELTGLTLNLASQGDYDVTVKIQPVGSNSSFYLSRLGSKPNTAGLDVVPIATEKDGVILSANTEFKVTLYCDKPFYVWISSTPQEKYEHFNLKFPLVTADNASSQKEYRSFPYGIFYKSLNVTGEKPSEVNETTTQKIKTDIEEYKPSEQKNVTTVPPGSNLVESRKKESFTLKTLEKRVELTGLKLKIASDGDYDVTVKIQQVGSVTPSYILFRQGNKLYPVGVDEVAISTEHERVVLPANTEFEVTLYSDKSLFVWISPTPHEAYENFTLKFPRSTAANAHLKGEYMGFLHGILYKTLSSEAKVTEKPTQQDTETTTQLINGASGGKRFDLVSKSMTFQDAERHCTGRGDRLARILNEKENDEALVLLKTKLAADVDHVYIGGKSINKGAQKYWLNPETPMNFTYFHPDRQPESDGDSCLEFWKKGGVWKWDDTDCSDHHPFICETTRP